MVGLGRISKKSILRGSWAFVWEGHEPLDTSTGAVPNYNYILHLHIYIYINFTVAFLFNLKKL